MSTESVKKLPISDLLEHMHQSLETYLDRNPLLIAIQTGGLWVGEYLHAAVGATEPLGALDISFYRDDFSRIGLNPQVKASSLPVAIKDRHVVLIDDVLYTGRTIRAAMNELFAWGRPSCVTLAVLLDRGGRELPIRADIVGYNLTMDDNQIVKVAPDGTLAFSNIIGT